MVLYVKCQELERGPAHLSVPTVLSSVAHPMGRHGRGMLIIANTEVVVFQATVTEPGKLYASSLGLKQ